METVKLKNGIEMPIIGYGVFLVEPDECQKCVGDALEVGYRMIDTAQAYYNEEGVGKAWVKSGLKREDLFLVSKVWISNAGDKKAYDSILKSLDKLQTDYIDLMLIHQPYGDYYGTYRAMERAYKEGKLKAIGVSNFLPDRFLDISNNMEIKPQINQLETNVFCQRKEDRKHLEKFDTNIMAWGPLGHGSDKIFNNDTLKNIGEKYGKTPAQVALRFLTQENIIIIPKSTHKERMAQNLNIFDFKMDENELNTLRNLDVNGISAKIDSPELAEYLINYVKTHGEV